MLASQMRVAFANIVLKTGSRSPGDEPMTLRTSDVAACCYNASSLVLGSTAIHSVASAVEGLRRRAILFRRFRALRRCVFTALPPALSRRLIAPPRSGRGIVSVQTGALKGARTGFVQVLSRAGLMTKGDIATANGDQLGVRCPDLSRRVPPWQQTFNRKVECAMSVRSPNSINSFQRISEFHCGGFWKRAPQSTGFIMNGTLQLHEYPGGLVRLSCEK